MRASIFFEVNWRCFLQGVDEEGEAMAARALCTVTEVQPASQPERERERS